MGYTKIPNHSRYRIDEMGNIQSCTYGDWRDLKPIESHKYLRIWIYDDLGNKYKVRIHVLVALTYIPNPNNHPIVMHKDDNPRNNHYKNLQWGTTQMNSADMVKKGRAKNGYITGTRKIRL